MKRSLVMFVVMIIGIAAAASPAAELALRIGDLMPSHTLAALTGPAVTIPDDVRGKVTVVHFWTDSCGSCREEMPALDRLYAQYARKGLTIVAVNVGQSKPEVQKFVDTFRVSYPVLLDAGKESTRRYCVAGVPRTYILDRSGTIRYKILGEATEETLKKMIVSMLH